MKIYTLKIEASGDTAVEAAKQATRLIDMMVRDQHTKGYTQGDTRGNAVGNWEIADNGQEEFSSEGWITRAGKFVSCDREFSHPIAAMIELGGSEDTAELRAEKLGWLRLSDHGDRMTKDLNQAQLNTLWDYCTHLGIDFKSLLTRIERL